MGNGLQLFAAQQRWMDDLTQAAATTGESAGDMLVRRVNKSKIRFAAHEQSLGGLLVQETRPGFALLEKRELTLKGQRETL